MNTRLLTHLALQVHVPVSYEIGDLIINKATTSQNLSWALMTIKERLQFGLPEEEAIKRREVRVKGVLTEAIPEIEELERQNKALIEIVNDFITAVEHAHYLDYLGEGSTRKLCLDAVDKAKAELKEKVD